MLISIQTEFSHNQMVAWVDDNHGGAKVICGRVWAVVIALSNGRVRIDYSVSGQGGGDFKIREENLYATIEAATAAIIYSATASLQGQLKSAGIDESVFKENVDARDTPWPVDNNSS